MDAKKLRKLRRSILKSLGHISPLDLENAFKIIYKAGYSDGCHATSKKFYKILEKEILKGRKVK